MVSFVGNHIKTGCQGRCWKVTPLLLRSICSVVMGARPCASVLPGAVLCAETVGGCIGGRTGLLRAGWWGWHGQWAVESLENCVRNNGP